MKAKLKNGKTIKGKLADTFCRLGIAVEVKEAKTEQPITNNTPVVKQEVKRKRRTKTEIEADKKRKNEKSI
jgi:hypothetical protein